MTRSRPVFRATACVVSGFPIYILTADSNRPAEQPHYGRKTRDTSFENCMEGCVIDIKHEE